MILGGGLQGKQKIFALISVERAPLTINNTNDSTDHAGKSILL